MDFAQEIDKINISSELKELLKQILEKDPVKRATFDQILSDKWFEGHTPETFSTEEDIF
jgi:hypothetical protein